MKTKIGIVVVIFIFISVGCSFNSKNSDIYPLTGLKSDKEKNNRPISVMVNNHPDARPQTGLSEADIVFEILAEGNITRFLAIFQSEQPKVVGPVRSAREYYFELAKGYDALYVYHGSAKKVEKKLQASGVDSINGAFHDDDKKLFKREDFRVAPHNSYVLLDAVYDQAEKVGYKLESKQKPLAFLKEDQDVEGKSANEIKIDYASSLVEYTYDATNETYLRYNDNEQTVELTDEKPIEIDNILIVKMDHETIDKEGRRAIDIESGGDAYLFQKGQVQFVEWENSDGRIIPVNSGEEIGLVKGKTWINVVPNTYELKDELIFNE